MSKTKNPIAYEISSIDDIFRKIPADRIQHCCEELGTMLAANKATVCAMHSILEQKLGAECPPLQSMLVMSYPMTWIDDNKGELVTKLTHEGQEIGEIRIEREARR